eukprot:CAMPEP_0195510884 /NCGR_PEP_ID=MMETSP0794_2-20130614/3395_1 /TAXON_ID=515487 /ORGANISM="Stephanopyxis turris, Strain CCMP 815" /LENGTH=617 /DNA_ID=CAMNT_0040638393 /DNA_START=132 /DNA_END=1985 /DNA_ORIENTATION=+
MNEECCVSSSAIQPSSISLLDIPLEALLGCMVLYLPINERHRLLYLDKAWRDTGRKKDDNDTRRQELSSSNPTSIIITTTPEDFSIASKLWDESFWRYRFVKRFLNITVSSSMGGFPISHKTWRDAFLTLTNLSRVRIGVERNEEVLLDDTSRSRGYNYDFMLDVNGEYIYRIGGRYLCHIFRVSVGSLRLSQRTGLIEVIPDVDSSYGCNNQKWERIRLKGLKRLENMNGRSYTSLSVSCSRQPHDDDDDDNNASHHPHQTLPVIVCFGGSRSAYPHTETNDLVLVIREPNSPKKEWRVHTPIEQGTKPSPRRDQSATILNAQRGTICIIGGGKISSPPTTYDDVFIMEIIVHQDFLVCNDNSTHDDNDDEVKRKPLVVVVLWSTIEKGITRNVVPWLPSRMGHCTVLEQSSSSSSSSSSIIVFGGVRHGYTMGYTDVWSATISHNKKEEQQDGTTATIEVTWNKQEMINNDEEELGLQNLKGHSLTRIGGNMIVFGGHNGKEVFRQLRVMDPFNRTWYIPSHITYDPQQQQQQQQQQRINTTHPQPDTDNDSITTTKTNPKPRATVSDQYIGRTSHRAELWGDKLVVSGGYAMNEQKDIRGIRLTKLDAISVSFT